MADYLLFDELEIGLTFPDKPVEYPVVGSQVNQYLTATGDTSAAFKETTGAKQLAPPSLSAIYMIEAMKALKSPPGGVHAKQKFVFHQPAYVGDTLFTTCFIKEKYVKKGRNYVVMESVTKNQNGEPVTTSEITRIWSK